MTLDKDPIQINNDKLGCPDCKTPLISGGVPMKCKRLPIGDFDGLKCPKCKYVVLTEKGYKDMDEYLLETGLVELQKDGTLQYMDHKFKQSVVTGNENPMSASLNFKFSNITDFVPPFIQPIIQHQYIPKTLN